MLIWFLQETFKMKWILRLSESLYFEINKQKCKRVLLELGRVGRPAIVVLQSEHILPIDVIQSLSSGPRTFFLKQLVHPLNRLRVLEAFFSQLVALRCYLLHPLEQLHWNPMIHQLQTFFFKIRNITDYYWLADILTRLYNLYCCLANVVNEKDTTMTVDRCTR